tara:strand:+ start:27 stop:1481 length:1455 start_codon:yes stop_codon:yes gene_type:complete
MGMLNFLRGGKKTVETKSDLNDKKKPTFVSVDNVSIIIKPKLPKTPDGKIIFYDLSGNRISKIPRKKRDISTGINCYLGLKKYKNCERWEPIDSKEVEKYLSSENSIRKKFINDHSTSVSYRKKKKEFIKKNKVDDSQHNKYLKTIRNKIDDLVEKYKNESWMMSSKEVNKKRNSFFNNRFKMNIDKYLLDREVYFGVKGNNNGGIIFFSIKKSPILSFMNLGDSDDYDNEGHPRSFFPYSLTGKIPGYYIRFIDKPDNEVSLSLADDSDGIYFSSEQYPKKVSLKPGAVKFIKGLLMIIEEELITNNKQTRNSFLSKYDKDGNGVLDIVDSGGNLSKLVKKNQKKIIENDKNHLNDLIKLSIFLKTKRKNIQSLYDNLEDSAEDFDKVSTTIEIQIKAYSKLAQLSMRMVNCLIEDDLYTYLEIHNGFEAMGVFRSSFENELSYQLRDIGSNMHKILNSINEMDSNIASNLNQLSHQLELLED